MSDRHFNCTCWCCGADCYDVIDRFPEGHERVGEARRVGAMLPSACQVEFVLTDLSSISLSMCIGCAGRLTYEEYYAINRKVHEAWATSLQGRPDRDALVMVHRNKIILGRVAQRRESPDWQGRNTAMILHGGHDV